MKSFSIALASLLLASPAWPATIGIFATADCSSTELSLPIYGIATVYVAVNGLSTSPRFEGYGLAGAEFQIVGVPSQWIAQSFPAPVAMVAGGDLLHGGASILFHSAQTGDCVLLYTVRLVALTSANDVALQVKTSDSRLGDPLHSCPLGIPYTPPVYGLACMDGDALLINSTTAVERSSWSAVKRIYE